MGFIALELSGEFLSQNEKQEQADDTQQMNKMKSDSTPEIIGFEEYVPETRRTR